MSGTGEIPHLSDRLTWLTNYSPPLYIGCAGGGGYLLHLLTGTVGGASRFFLGGHLSYASRETESFIGRRLKQFCSPETAIVLAEAARLRAGEGGLGLGLTAAFVSDRSRKGDERFHLALSGKGALRVFTRRFDRTGEAIRPLQDRVLAAAAIQELGRLLNAPFEDELVTLEEHAAEPAPQPRLFRPDGSSRTFTPREIDPLRTLVYSGSFNPLHEGHRTLASAAARASGGKSLLFEIPVSNAEDAKSVDLGAARNRTDQFRWYGSVVVVPGIPTFIQKIRYYGDGVAFVLGADTAARLFEPRYYGGSDNERDLAFRELAVRGARFFVGTRRDGSGVLRTGLEHIPEQFTPLFISIPLDIPVSSTALRARTAATVPGFAELLPG